MTDSLIEKVLGDPERYPDVFKSWVARAVQHTPTLQITAGQVSDLGVWKDYTPSWSSEIGWTPPSLGNGSLTGRFVRNGRFVHGWIHLIWGSTTTGGTGNWHFSLPSPIAFTMRGGIGFADAIDVSSGQAFMGMTTLRARSSVEVWTPQSPIGVWQQGVAAPPATPFIWASGDEARLEFTYEETSPLGP